MSDTTYSASESEDEDRNDLSTPSFDADFEDARNLFRAQIASLRRTLPTIPLFLGLLPVISRLPEELLCAVFKSLASEDVPSGASKNLGWIKATHVCRHWRCVALSNPTLWTNLDFNLGRWWANVILARSQAVPLDVTLTVVSGEEHGDHIVRNNMERIRSLDVIVPTIRPESFKLVHDPKPTGGRITRIYTVPGTFLSSMNSPRLQRLSLSGGQPGSGACYNLTDLELSCLSSRFIPSLFRMLPQLDRLAALAIDINPFLCTLDERAYWMKNLVRENVSLPLVERFALDGRDPECSVFLAQLVMPHLSSFKFTCFVTSNDPEDHRSVLDLLQHFVRESNMAIKDHASFVGWVYVDDWKDNYDPEHPEYTCCFTVSSQPSWDNPYPSSIPGDAPGISVEFSWGDNAIPPLLERAAQLCHAIWLGDVHTMYLDLIDMESVFEAQAMHSLPALLQQLPSLDHLAIDYSTMTDFYDELLEVDYLEEDGDPDTITTFWEVVRSELPEASFDEPDSEAPTTASSIDSPIPPIAVPSCPRV
ncbi:hypothetical protein EWM64_g340 [Hericium alpestre]|uniref:F-box domain-containing protein n=1 Tax=Hericium alpestre TaxID=135208 RepID=A0A4Z0ABE3_9AGAM|nr:hypothetical protein EWM64_g340 [Hericium alpestre]